MFTLHFIFNTGKKLVEGLISSILSFFYVSCFLCRSSVVCSRCVSFFNSGKKNLLMYVFNILYFLPGLSIMTNGITNGRTVALLSNLKTVHYLLSGAAAIIGGSWYFGRNNVWKSDLKEAIEENKEDFKALKVELKEDFGSLKAEIKEDFKALKVELKEDFGSLKAEVKEDFKALKVELKEDFGSLKVELKEDFGSLKIELKEDLKYNFKVLKEHLNEDLAKEFMGLAKQLKDQEAKFTEQLQKLELKMK